MLGEVDVDKTILSGDTKLAPKAPGMKYRHYAPKGQLTIVTGASEKVVEYINAQVVEAHRQGKKVGIIGTEELLASYQADAVKSAGSKDDEQMIAHNLFRILREFDDEEVDVIYSESFDNAQLGQAIMNRLLKAAGHSVKEV